MKNTTFTFKSYLEVANLESLKNELLNADLSDPDITDKLITQVFSLFNALDLQTEIGFDFFRLVPLLNDLLQPLISKEYISLVYRLINDKPFIIIGSDKVSANEIISDGMDSVSVNNLLLDAHADVVPYSFFSNGRSIIQVDEHGNEYIFGRGANDMLTQNGVLIVLLYRLYRSNIKPPFITISTDEEFLNPGQSKFYRKILTPAAISLEPTGNLLGGYINQILEDKSFLVHVINNSNLTSWELSSKIQSYFEQKDYFEGIKISCLFDANDELRISFAPDTLSKQSIEKFLIDFRFFLQINKIHILKLFSVINMTRFSSSIKPKMRKVLTSSINNAYGEPELLHDDRVFTTAVRNGKSGSFALRNFFQCSLGLFLPNRKRNTIILSFPERGGRHNSTEHYKVGEPSMLLDALTQIVRDLKVSELEG